MLSFIVKNLYIKKKKKIITNPQSLNIKNTINLFEKLTPLFNYISSNIDEFIRKDVLYHPYCYFSIIVKLHFDHPIWGKYVDKNDEMFTKSISFLNIFMELMV